MQKTLAARMKIAQQRLSALERQDAISEQIISKALRALEISQDDALKLLGKINELNEIKSFE